jgi:hypothetical protein
MVTAAGGRLVFQDGVFHDLGFQDCKVKAERLRLLRARRRPHRRHGRKRRQMTFLIGIDPPLHTVAPGNTVDFKITIQSERERGIDRSQLMACRAAQPGLIPEPGNIREYCDSDVVTSTRDTTFIVSDYDNRNRVQNASAVATLMTDASQGELTVSTSLALTPEDRTRLADFDC